MRVEKDYDDDFINFQTECRARLKDGAREYGNESFNRNPQQLIGEIEEELMDVTNWSFILFARLQRIREALFQTDVDDELMDYQPNETDTSEH